MENKIARRGFLKGLSSLGLGAVATPIFSACGGSDSEAASTAVKTDVTQLSAMDAVNAVRNGSLSAVQCVTAALDKAEALSKLNAMISLDRVGALAEARKIDALRASGAVLPMLAGLPIVAKDNINSANLPTTGGTASLEANRPSQNAPTLQKLLDAGAILIGKANMHELAFGITSTNATVFSAASGLKGGAVANPYDTKRIPGGSSGGTAVAVAARMVAVGLGTDTGGSCRVPAALTGIVGFRPSVGNGGQERRYHDEKAVVPISHTRDTVGALARTVQDAALLDAVITGGALIQATSLSGLRIGIPSPMWANLDPAVQTIMDAVKARLVTAGVVFVELAMTKMMKLNDDISFPLALHEPVADIPAYLAANNAPVRTISAIAGKIASKDVQGAFGAIAGDVFGGAAYNDAMTVHRPALQQLYADTFSQNTVEALLFPTTPLPAVPIDLVNGSSTVMLNGSSVDTFKTFIRNTDPGSNAGIPGLSIPAGMTTNGLPVGLEIDGPVGADRRILAIGMAIEAVLSAVPAPVV